MPVGQVLVEVTVVAVLTVEEVGVGKVGVGVTGVVGVVIPQLVAVEPLRQTHLLFTIL